MTNRKSCTGFPTSYRWSAYVIFKSPKSSFWNKVNFIWMKSATKFLWEKTSRGKVVVHSFPYLMVHRCWGKTLTLQPQMSRQMHPLDEVLNWRYFGLQFLSCNSQLNVHLSLIGSRSRAFQRGIDKAPTFPLSLPKGGSKIPLRNFANRSNSCVACFCSQ